MTSCNLRTLAGLGHLLIAVLAVPAVFAEVPHLCDVRQHGAAGDGVALDTGPIQEAIDDCAALGGGTVYLPPGKYLSGTIRLKSGITLWLDSGAVIVGTADLAQYQAGAFILAKGVTNVGIMGHGTIDGNKVRNPKGEEHIRGPHVVLFTDARDIAVRDISIRDAGNFGMAMRSSERINVDGVTIRGGWDGINMIDCRDATISNCRLYTGDDSISGTKWENVTVSNCILNSSANAIRAGGRNLLFTNLIMYGPGEYAAGSSQRHRLEAGFQTAPNRMPKAGGKRLVTPGPIDNVVFSNITMVNVATPIFIAYGADALYSSYKDNPGVGRITFNNVTVTGAGLTPIYISAPPENPVKAIVLNNFTVSASGGGDEAQAREQGFSAFSILQAYGLYGRNVERLELNNVRFDLDKADGRSAIFAENCGTLELQRFRAMREPGGPPLVQLSGKGEISIDGQHLPAAEATVQSLDAPRATAGEPFHIAGIVRSGSTGGLAPVDLHIGSDVLHRRVWMPAGETAKISFLNLVRKEAGEVPVAAGAIRRTLEVTAKPAGMPVAQPYRTFRNTPGEMIQSARGFYIRGGGDYPLLQFGDQYAAIYEQKALPQHGTVVVKMENPDLRTNWVGRTGIIVRNDITKPGQSQGYLILAASPVSGAALEWDANGDGRLDEHTTFDGNTVWPVWLKVERNGIRFTGFSSADGAHWTRIGDAEVSSADDQLDAGIFAYRDSARFEGFRITK